jgi:hypothetical protein
MTDGRIRISSRDRGSAFAVTTRSVLTANHVVRGAEVSDLTFVPSSDGEPLHVTQIDCDEAMDVAVLYLDGTVNAPFAVVRARTGMEWRVSAQPLGNDPGLTGIVTDASRAIINSSGNSVVCLQLKVDQDLGSFSGYSGSAVRLSGPAGGVIGVLVEQVQHRTSRPLQASNVLYAVPIEQVLTRFKLWPANDALISGTNAIPALLAGLNSLNADYSGRINDFLLEYLGRPDAPVPFGGRHHQLKVLTSWLADNGNPPYALVVAQAGRGKSALLVQWAAHVSAAGLAHCVFIPISVRFNTAQAGVVFPALAARLANYYNDQMTKTELSAEQWKDACRAYLGRHPNTSKPLLIILDGLDEAADWRAGPDLFPALPPVGVRVVVSARYLAGDTDESGWRTRLNWSRPSLAASLPLPPLDVEGVNEVLVAMGNPLAGLVSRVDLVTELYRLSDGDPLIVRLYVEALLPFGDRAAAILPDELPSIRSGLNGYFLRWWDEQERLWQAQGKDSIIERQGLQDLLNALACALGPLTRDDLTGLDPRLPTGLHLRSLLKDIDRFVIGNGVQQGFVFSHPRLGIFFHDEMSSQERLEWTQRFLNYGSRTLEELRSRQRDPAGTPAYVIHFYGAHLEVAESLSGQLYSLLDSQWLAAWQAIDGSDSGFLNDCDRAWRRAEDDVLSATNRVMLERAVETQFVCALSRGSVAARSDNIPTRLLADATRHGLLTAAQSLAICRRMSDEHNRMQAVIALASELSPEWMEECVAITETLSREPFRASAVSDLASLLTGPALIRARVIAESLTQPESRARALAAVGSRLAVPERTRLADDALSAVAEIGDPRRVGRSLAAVGGYLPRSHLTLAVRMAEELAEPRAAVRALSALARYLDPADRARVVQEASQRAVELSDEALIRAEFALADHVPSRRQEAFRSLRALPDPHRMVGLLINSRQWLGEMDPQITDELLLAAAFKASEEEAIRLAELMSHQLRAHALKEVERFTVASEVATALLLAADGPNASQAAVTRAIEDAHALDHGRRALVLTLLAACQNGEAKLGLLREALQSAQTIDDISMQIDALNRVTKSLSGANLAATQAEIISLCQKLINPESVSKVFELLQTEILPENVGNALGMCLSLRPVMARIKALEQLSKRVPQKYRRELNESVLQHVGHIKDVKRRIEVLEELRSRFARYGSEFDQALLDAVHQLPSTEHVPALLKAVSSLITTQAKQLVIRRLIDLARSQIHSELTLDSLIEVLPNELPDDLVSDLMVLVGQTEPRFRSLIRLLWWMPARLMESTILQAESRAEEENLDQWRWQPELASAVAATFARLPDDDVKRGMLPIILRPGDGRLERIRMIATTVPDELRGEIVRTVWSLPLGHRVALYRSLKRHYPEKLLETVAKSIVVGIGDGNFYGVGSLLELADSMPVEKRDTLLNDTFRITRQLSDLNHQLTELHNILLRGPSKWQTLAANEIIELVKARQHEIGSLVAASALCDLPDEYLREAEQLIMKSSEPDVRINALLRMLLRVGNPKEETRLRTQIAVELRQLPSGPRRAALVEMLGCKLPGVDEWSAALELLINLEESLDKRLRLLLMLTRQVTPPRRDRLIEQALSMATGVQNNRERERALLEVAPFAATCPSAVLGTLQAVASMQSHDLRSKALASIAPGIPASVEQNAAAVRAWSAAIRTISANPRPVLMSELALLATNGITALLPQEKMASLFVTAIKTVSYWWA